MHTSILNVFFTDSIQQKPVTGIVSPAESRMTSQQRSSSSGSYSDSQPIRQDVTNQVQQPIREAVPETGSSVQGSNQVGAVMMINFFKWI